MTPTYVMKLTAEERHELIGILEREYERAENVIAFRVTKLLKAVQDAGRLDGAEVGNGK